MKVREELTAVAAMFRRLLIVGAVVLMNPLIAGADLWTEEDTFSGTGTFTDTLEFDKFNPAGTVDYVAGTLTSIEILMEVSSTGGLISVDNDQETSQSVTTYFQQSGSLSSSDVMLASLSPNDPIVLRKEQTFNLGPDEGDEGAGQISIDPTPSDGDSMSGINNAVPSSGNAFISSTFWFMYTGTDTFTIKTNAVNSFGVVGDGDIQVGITQNPTISGTVKVIYSFTPTNPIPEPATMLLFGTGLIGLAGVGRKKFMTKR